MAAIEIGSPSPTTRGGQQWWVIASVVVTAAFVVWAQLGPGFGWDEATAGWILETIPGLEMLAVAIGWPLANPWGFATIGAATCGAVALVGRKRDVVFVLAAVGGGVMIDWLLGSLLTAMSPISATLLFGSLAGGAARAVHKSVSRNVAVGVWSSVAIVALTTGLAAIAVDASPSAVVMSLGLAGTWIVALDNLAR